MSMTFRCIKNLLNFVIVFFVVLHFSLFLVSSSTAPDFDWIQTVTVSDDLTVSLHGLDCGTNIPRLQCNGWTKSVVNPQVDRYTSNGQTVVVNQTEVPTGVVVGSFSLRFTSQSGTSVTIKGRDYCF